MFCKLRQLVVQRNVKTRVEFSPLHAHGIGAGVTLDVRCRRVDIGRLRRPDRPRRTHGAHTADGVKLPRVEETGRDGRGYGRHGNAQDATLDR